MVDGVESQEDVYILTRPPASSMVGAKAGMESLIAPWIFQSEIYGSC
jgi:hypothetical protein